MPPRRRAARATGRRRIAVRRRRSHPRRPCARSRAPDRTGCRSSSRRHRRASESASRLSASSRSYGYGGGTNPPGADIRADTNRGCSRTPRSDRRPLAGGGRARACRVIAVHLDEHLAGAVQRGEHVAAVVRDDVLRDACEGPQPVADRGRAARAAFTRRGRDRDRTRMRVQEGLERVGVGDVGLVPHEQAGTSSGVDLRQHRADRVDRARRRPRRSRRRCGQQVGVDHLLERGAERLDELVRQAPHEADGVGQQHASRRPGRCRRRTVGSRVENSWSCTSTPACVSRLSSVDLPAFV